MASEQAKENLRVLYHTQLLSVIRTLLKYSPPISELFPIRTKFFNYLGT